MDISATLAPDSTQLNADDLIGHNIVITVRDVTAGNAEQPVNIHSHEYPDRAYRPSKTMRKLISAAWGNETTAWIGRRLELFRNPDIKFGRDVVGGIEIASMSHIEKPLTVALTVTRGKRKPFTVQPLKDSPKPAQPAVDWDAELEQAGGDMDAIRAMYNRAQQLGDRDGMAKVKAAGDAVMAAQQQGGNDE